MKYVCPYGHIEPYTDRLPTRTRSGIIVPGYSRLFNSDDFWLQYKLWEALRNPFSFPVAEHIALRYFCRDSFRAGLNP